MIALNQGGKLALARKSLEVLTNHVRTYGKYFRRLEQLDPSRFVELPQCGDLVLFYWSQVVDATGGPMELVEGKAESTRSRYLTELVNHRQLCSSIPHALLGARYGIVKGQFVTMGSDAARRVSQPEQCVTFSELRRFNLTFVALSREFVQTAAQLLITRFMPLNPLDLENWLADPEEWLNLEDKENDQWEYEIRVRESTENPTSSH